jgi:hypothetical protein
MCARNKKKYNRMYHDDDDNRVTFIGIGKLAGALVLYAFKAWLGNSISQGIGLGI